MSWNSNILSTELLCSLIFLKLNRYNSTHFKNYLLTRILLNLFTFLCILTLKRQDRTNLTWLFSSVPSLLLDIKQNWSFSFSSTFIVFLFLLLHLHQGEYRYMVSIYSKYIKPNGCWDISILQVSETSQIHKIYSNQKSCAQYLK